VGEETGKPEYKQVWFGFNEAHEKVVWAEEARKQLEELKKYEIDLIDDEGKNVTWDDLYSPTDDRVVLSYVIRDREIREHNLMADRPPFAIFTIFENKVVRFEFYQGHDELSKVIDVISPNHKFTEDSYEGW
jgi:hypothetical protein